MFEYYLFLVLKLTIGFGLIITYLYVTGKYQLSKMTPIDFIGNFIIGGAVGGVIYSDTITMLNYVSTLTIALLIVHAISVISERSSAAKAVTIGIPLVLINNGEFCLDTINENKSKIDFCDVLSKLHQRGITRFENVGYLQLEPTGDIVVANKNEPKPSVIIYSNDGFLSFNTERLNLDVDYIQELIDEHHLEDIIFIEFNNGDLLFITEKGSLTLPIK